MGLYPIGVRLSWICNFNQKVIGWDFNAKTLIPGRSPSVKKAGGLVEEEAARRPSPSKEIAILEMDELYTYI